MSVTRIAGVTVVPGDGRSPTVAADVELDSDGIVVAIEPTTTPTTVERMLVPAAVDVHLDNLTERRRPRATVRLDQHSVLAVLDAECAAVGIGTVCISARCEDAPRKGVHVEDAAELARTLEEMAPTLACDWRIHARVEVTDDAALPALEAVVAATSRVAIISVMEHSVERSRFATPEAHRAFYAEDWGVPLEEVDRILAAKAEGAADRDRRRETVAELAAHQGIVLASHDDRSPDDIDAGRELGATIAEFPLTTETAAYARQQGLATVLGAPNAVRGRSTSPGNILVTEAVAAGVVDILCSDYLPSSLQSAPHALVAAGVLDLGRAVDLVSTAPARVLGLPSPVIEIGRPLTAALGMVSGTTFVGQGLWRAGRMTFLREPAGVVRATRPAVLV